MNTIRIILGYYSVDIRRHTARLADLATSSSMAYPLLFPEEDRHPRAHTDVAVNIINAMIVSSSPHYRRYAQRGHRPSCPSHGGRINHQA